MYQFSVDFECDEIKSEANHLKHGVSLEEAKILWLGFAAESRSVYPNEERWLRVGVIADKFFTCIFTYRGKKVRIISFRRSREAEILKYQEVLNYEKEKNNFS